MKSFEPLNGIKIWKNKKNALVFRLHYSADPNKTAEWAIEQKRGMDPQFAAQELEIDFGATSGQLLYYNYHDEYTLEDDFIVPEHWTRYFVLDPHISKPHAALWLAVDPENFIHCYREFWPSKVKGTAAQGVPEDDFPPTPREFMECVAWFESKENPQNGGKAEKIYDRIIDYAGRAFKKGNVAGTEDNQVTFEQMFEDAAEELASQYPGFECQFVDAKKDNKDVGIQLVNTALLPKKVLKKNGSGYEDRSVIQIMRGRCPELVWQLKHNRRQQQTAQQKEKQDPEIKRIAKRNDLSDCLTYGVRHEPEYIEQHSSSRVSSWLPAHEGVSY